jgi:tetratricopeptide (TPR) repeat protein
MHTPDPTITLCMIVRNEAAMLADCLKSVEGLVSDIIVVDTGSTDETRDIAASFGAHIVESQWNDSFAQARNISIKDARGDWILWLDADERLRPSEHDRVRKAIRASATYAYNVPVLNEDGKGGHYSRGHRLFRNGQGIYFSGRVHEQISPSFPNRKVPVPHAQFTIDHLGYNLAEDHMAKKHARNMRLLNMAKTKNPRDAYVRFTLGQAHLIAGDYDAAEKEIKAALGELRTQRMNKPLPADIRAAGQCNLADCALKRGDFNEAIRRCQASLKLCPKQATAHLFSYKAHKAASQLECALQDLEQVEALIEENPTENRLSAIDTTVDPLQLLNSMGQLCLNLGQLARAEGYLRQVVKHKPDHIPALSGLAHCALASDRLDDATAYSERALQHAPNDAGIRELLSMALIRSGDFNDAADHLAVISDQYPENADIKKRLAGVMVKAGRMDEAKGVLVQLNALTAQANS